MSSDHALILAVDGGGSKTDVALLQSDGELLSAVRGPGSSPEHLGLEKALAVVERVIEAVAADAGVALGDGRRAEVGAFFMAGADLAEDERRLGTALEAHGWADRVHLANDGFALLWAATGGEYGIACAVGTGMNCVGRLEDGRRAWFPALGAVTGDWGGGRDIGLAALGVAVRAEDRRGPATGLSAAIASHFGCDTATEVAVAVQKRRIDLFRLRELAPIVLQAARLGDPEAVAIFERQGSAVVTFVRGALLQLGVVSDPVDIVLGGSIMVAAGSLFVDGVREGIRELAPRSRVVVCRDRPVVGAAIAGLEMVGSDPVAAARVRAMLDDSRIRVAPDLNGGPPPSTGPVPPLLLP
jgi:N-acetylglucosamine kinase-like BadF-type ATPase